MFSNAVRTTAEEVIGFETTNHRDWFEENRSNICELLAENNLADDNILRSSSSAVLRQRFADLRAHAQRELRRIENQWWVSLAEEIQRYADDNDTHNFYNHIKEVYGPTTHPTTPVRSADSATLINRKSPGGDGLPAEIYIRGSRGSEMPAPSDFLYMDVRINAPRMEGRLHNHWKIQNFLFSLLVMKLYGIACRWNSLLLLLRLINRKFQEAHKV